MKKFLSLTLLLAASIAVNAQLFIGGSVGLSVSGGSTKTGGVSTDKPSTTAFDLRPMAGIYFSNDFLAGLQLSYTVNRTKTPNQNGEVISNTQSYGLSPFARYHFLRFGKFSAYGQGAWYSF